MQRRRPALPLAIAVLALVVPGCGGGDEAGAEGPPPDSDSASAPEPSGPVTVTLSEVNGSGLSGTATLTPGEARSFEVVVEVPGGDGPAHIHEVTCAEYARMSDFDEQAGTVSDSLGDLVNGTSTTEVTLFEDDALAERTTGSFSINVHAPEGPFPATACGDIPRR